jgi:ATP-dependent DNA helicase RecG
MYRSADGSNTAREKSQLKKLVAEGLAHVAIGTHALLESDVEFRRLGLAIIDEQHRFGVMQRLKLYEKGQRPDVLVMTATPIPRTLALTVYGDLDTSIIDELPPGRKPIQTKHVMEDRVEQVYSFVKKQVEAGRQAYVGLSGDRRVRDTGDEGCPSDASAVVGDRLPGSACDALARKMPPDEKEQVMAQFKAGESDVLVSTTVIEVGVDVPNATSC